MKKDGSRIRRALRTRGGKFRALIARVRRQEAADHTAGAHATPPAPYGADWTFRPWPWCQALHTPRSTIVPNQFALCDSIKVFHDLKNPEQEQIILQQNEQQSGNHSAPYQFSIETSEFDGDFLSIAMDLPASGMNGLGQHHLMCIQLTARCDKPVEGFLRLNVVNGPNTDQITGTFLLSGDGDTVVELDLAYTDVNEHRVERGWLDLILTRPDNNTVLLHDLTIYRMRRAEF